MINFNLLSNLLSRFSYQKQDGLKYSINAFLCLLLAVIFIYQGYLIIQLVNASDQRSSIMASKNVSRSFAKTNFSIADWHLLNEQGNAAVVEVKTKWMLRGIIIGQDQENNLAIIASSDTDESVYKQGDKLADGTIVTRIEPDKVLLEQFGNIETLFMPWKKAEHQEGDE